MESDRRKKLVKLLAYLIDNYSIEEIKAATPDAVTHNGLKYYKLKL